MISYFVLLFCVLLLWTVSTDWWRIQDWAKSSKNTGQINFKHIVDIEKQSELAEVLHNSSPSSTLLASIEKRIPYPTPVLSLSLTHVYKQSGKMEEAIKFAKSYLSCIKETGYKSSNIHQFLILKVIIVWYQSILSFQTRITFYHETIAEFTKFMGEKHMFTLQAKFECA